MGLFKKLTNKGSKKKPKKQTNEAVKKEFEKKEYKSPKINLF